MKKMLIGGALSFLLFSPLLVFAQVATPNTSTVTYPNTPVVSSPNTPTAAPSGATGFVLQNPLNISTICGLIKEVLNAILALGIPVAMLFLVYAGFLFVKARGDPGGLKKARENLVHVIVGIGIFLGAWLLGQIIANTINAINPGTISGINSCS